MSALQPHLHILLAGWRQRRNQGSLWIWALITGLAYVVPTFIYLGGGPAQGFVITTVVLLMLALLVAWGIIVQSLHSQNTPAAARLVPGHARQVRQSLLAMWLTIGVLAATINGLAFGHGWFYGVAAWVAMGVIELTYRHRLWVAGFFMGLGLALVFLKGTVVAQSVVNDAAVYLYTEQPLAPLLTIAMVLWACMARFVVGHGDARHRKAFERASRWHEQMQAMQSGKNSMRHQGRIGWRITWLVWAPYRWWMQRLLRQAHATPSHVMARAMLGFGPNQHWTTQASFAAFFILFAGLLYVLLVATMGIEAVRPAIVQGLGTTVIFIIGMTISFLVGQRQSLHQSRREQSLLMLLPGMPRGADLNRALAAHWLIRFSMTWLVSCALLWAVIQLAKVEPWAMGFVIVSLTVSVLLLRDWSAMRFANTTPMLWAMVGYVWAGGACSWLLYRFDLSPWPILAMVAAPTLVALRWRWTKLGGYRQALPAGRWG